VNGRTVRQGFYGPHFEISLNKDGGSLADTGETGVRTLVEGENIVPVGVLADDLFDSVNQAVCHVKTFGLTAFGVVLYGTGRGSDRVADPSVLTIHRTTAMQGVSHV
jgi:hypothetical protein